MNAGGELNRSQDHNMQDDIAKDQAFQIWQGRELSSIECGKVKQILAACEDSGDLETLIALASSTNGLINDEVRKTACMLMGRLRKPIRSCRT